MQFRFSLDNLNVYLIIVRSFVSGTWRIVATSSTTQRRTKVMQVDHSVRGWSYILSCFWDIIPRSVLLVAQWMGHVRLSDYGRPKVLRLSRSGYPAYMPNPGQRQQPSTNNQHKFALNKTIPGISSSARKSHVHSRWNRIQKVFIERNFQLTGAFLDIVGGQSAQRQDSSRKQDDSTWWSSTSDWQGLSDIVMQQCYKQYRKE